MTDEEALIAAYVRSPSKARRLVLADWFDEREDPRGGWLRDPELVARIPRGRLDLSPVRDLCKAVEAGDPDASRLLVRIGPPAVPGLLHWQSVTQWPIRERYAALIADIRQAVPGLNDAAARLQSADPEEVLAALADLDRIGPAAVAAMTELMPVIGSDDERIRAAVCELAGRLRYSAGDVLSSLADRVTGNGGIGADVVCPALARLGIRSFQSLLVPVIVRAPHAHHAADALRSLGVAAAEEIICHALYQWPSDAPPPDELLHSFGERVIPLLEQTARAPAQHGYPRDVRIDAARALGRFGAAAVSVLVGLVRDAESAEVRKIAADALGRCGDLDAAAVTVLRGCLRDGPDPLRATAYGVLAGAGPAAGAALPDAAAHLGSDDTATREAAGRFVLRFGDRAALVRRLRRELTEGVVSRRAATARGLDAFAADLPEVVELYRLALTSPAEPVRAMAVGSLFRATWPAGVPLELARIALRDPSPAIRRDATRKLDAGPAWRGLAPDLARLRADADPAVRQRVAVVLGWWGVPATDS